MLLVNALKDNKPRFNKQGNIKLGEGIYSWSKLYGDMDYKYLLFGEEKTIKGTCQHCCEGCKGTCYVKKSMRYSTVIASHIRNTLAFRNDLNWAFDILNGILDRARKKPIAVRIDQSGELETVEEFLKWNESALKHPKQQFFIYTKRFNIVIPTLLRLYEEGNLAPNFVINISIWHELGIKEFQQVKHIPNVKAFVYDDGTFDYAKYGIVPQTWCNAYGDDGKLNHDITCAKCKKCFNCHPKCQIIFCHEH